MSILDIFQRRKDRRENSEFRRLYSRIIAQDVLMGLPYIGMWVKNSKFELMEISEQAAKILYNRTSNECVGLTDYQIAQECGAVVSEKQFADICRASDLSLKDEKPVVFIEFIEDTSGRKHIWKTIKANVALHEEKYYFGFAMFMDEMLGGYEAAISCFERDLPLLIKVNAKLYRYK